LNSDSMTSAQTVNNRGIDLLKLKMSFLSLINIMRGRTTADRAREYHERLENELIELMGKMVKLAEGFLRDFEIDTGMQIRDFENNTGVQK